MLSLVNANQDGAKITSGVCMFVFIGYFGKQTMWIYFIVIIVTYLIFHNKLSMKSFKLIIMQTSPDSRSFQDRAQYKYIWLLVEWLVILDYDSCLQRWMLCIHQIARIWIRLMHSNKDTTSILKWWYFAMTHEVHKCNSALLNADKPNMIDVLSRLSYQRPSIY